MISIILPVYNEAHVIRHTLESLLAQCSVDVEILVIDGCSTDGSQAIVAEMAMADKRIRLFINDRKHTPFAFNTGIREAVGDYIAILGAHCEYDPNYLRICLENILERDVVGCSGKVITRRANPSFGATLAAAVMSNPFAVSNSSFRTQSEGYCDTVPYPVFRKDVIQNLGGYNEQMLRNQDNDLNYRIRKSGGRLYCTHSVTCVYYARPTLRSLLSYAAQNGSWCGVSARLEPKSLAFRHYAPLAFVFALTVGLLCTIIGIAVAVQPLVFLGLLSLGLIPIHLLLGYVSCLHLILKQPLQTLIAPAVILAFHMQYGIAFLIGLFRPPIKIVETQSALGHASNL